MADDRYTRLRSISGRLRDIRDELEEANEPYSVWIGEAIAATHAAADKVEHAAHRAGCEAARTKMFGRG